MGLFEINKKIIEFKELQNQAVNSLNAVAHNVSGNNIISRAEISDLNDSLNSLVQAQKKIIVGIKALRGEALPEPVLAQQFQKIIADGSAENLFSALEVERFLSITSDVPDFKEAIVALQNEIINGVFAHVKEGYVSDVVSMINKAVESYEEFLNIKKELFDELKQRYSMIYIGLSERGYRFDESATAVKQEDPPIGDKASGMHDLTVVEAERQEEKEESLPEFQPEIEPEVADNDNIIPQPVVMWTGNNKKKISKCLGDFIETNRRTGSKYKGARFGLISKLEDLHYYGLITEQTCEGIIGKSDFEWLLKKEYVAKTVLPVSGLSVISISNNGVAIINDKTIKEMSYGKEGLKDRQVLISAAEYFKNENEEQIIQLAAMGETVAVLLSLLQYPVVKTIDIAYKYILLRFRVKETTCGICLCTEELTEEGYADISEVAKNIDVFYGFNCLLKRSADGIFLGEIEAVGQAEGFTFKIGEDDSGVVEFLENLANKVEGLADLAAESVAEEAERTETEEDIKETLDELQSEEPAPQMEVFEELTEEMEAASVESEEIDEIAVADAAVVAEETVLNETVENTDEKYFEEHEEKIAEISARNLTRLLINDNKSPANSVSDYLNLMDRLVCENRTAIALALGYALRNEHKDYADYYECLKSACGVGLDPITCGLSDLPVAEYNPRRRLAYQACAYTRVLIKADTAEYYSVLTGAKSLLDYDWGNMTAWKKALKAVLDTLDVRHQGFLQKILIQLTDTEQQDKLLSSIIREAEGFLVDSSWTPNDQSKIFYETFKRAFGQESKIYKLLTAVSKNDKTAVAQVEEFLKDFYANNGGFDSKKMQDFRYKNWKEQGGREKLTSKIGNNFDKKLIDRLEILDRWTGLVNSVVDEKGIKELRRRKSELVKLFEAAASGDGTFEGALFAQTAEDLIDYLNVKDKKNFTFAEFLLTDKVAVDANLSLPMLDDLSGEINELKSYHAILEHVALEHAELKPEELIKERMSEDNYGMAMSVSNVYGLPAETNAKARKYAKDDFKKVYDGISADLNMAYTRGLIDEDFLSKRLKEAENIYQVGEEIENYGFCRKLFERFHTAIDKSAIEKEKELNKRFESLQNDKAEEDNPIFTSIRTQIEAKNYTVAEEYLTRAESGESEVDETQIDEFDAHADFFKKYDSLYRFCQKYEGKTMEKMSSQIGDKVTEDNRVELCLPENAANNDIKAGCNWLRVLPNEGWLRGTPHSGQFLQLLNFDVTGSKKIRSANNEFVDEYTINPSKANLATYSHPISLFGTRVGKLSLFYINGKKGESTGELIKSHQGDFTSNAVIVYLDSAMKKETRRKLAKDIKTLHLPQTVLVIDRTLAVYLAFTKQAKRLSTMLKCTLPYTDFNPYCSSGSGKVDSEMFMGRERERNEISDMNNNTCLVCGGRQLGKTVLLDRVRETMHIPENKKFAVGTGTKGDGTNQVLGKIVAGLKDEKCRLIGEQDKIATWDELCDKLLKLYKEGKYKTLMLFIDEGDAFIEEQHKNDYKALESLTLLRKQTNNAFKFVLAGLHNISRESHDENGFLAQLGSPLIIKPFSMREAKQLVEVPLLYLGYKFEQPDRLLPLILSHTNYYPGLLHLFCSDLIKYLSANFNRYFNEVENPPYTVSEEHVKAVVTSTNFKDRVKSTFDITLKVQSNRYKKIAVALAILYLEKPSQPGYTAAEIKEYADWAYHEDLVAYHNLLTEMCDLGMIVEIKTEDGAPTKYVFLRNAFFGYVCDVDMTGRKDKEDQIDLLLSELSKIGQEEKSE